MQLFFTGQRSAFHFNPFCPQRSGYKATKLVDTPTHATLMDVTGLGGPIKMDSIVFFTTETDGRSCDADLDQAT